MTTPDQPMLTTRQIAEIFNASPKWVREQCANGRFPCHRIGRDYRMTTEQLKIAKVSTLKQNTEPKHSSNKQQTSQNHPRRQP